MIFPYFGYTNISKEFLANSNVSLCYKQKNKQQITFPVD